MKNTNVTKNIETYTCPICGAETPARFTVDASYGHVCYACARNLWEMWYCGQYGKYGNLLGTTAWNGTTITKDMGKEASDLMDERYDAGETLVPHAHFYECVMDGVCLVELDLIENNKDWKDTYEEYSAEAFEEYGEDTFTRDEVMICMYSIFQNNVKHFQKAKLMLGLGCVWSE